MPQLHTRVEIKLQDPICQRLDRCRGDVPRATWIREAILLKLDVEEFNQIIPNIKKKKS